MKQIQNLRDYPVTIAVDPPVEVEAGGVVEVDDDLAKNLLLQVENWGAPGAERGAAAQKAAAVKKAAKPRRRVTKKAALEAEAPPAPTAPDADAVATDQDQQDDEKDGDR